MKSKKSATTEGDYIQEGAEEILSSLRPVKSVSKSRTVSGAGVLSVINSKENGKRLALSSELLQKIGNPDKVQVCLAEKIVAIGKSISGCESSFLLKKGGNKGLIYSYGLVNEITNEFKLDFSNRTSLTFHEVEYLTDCDNTIAIVTISVDSNDTDSDDTEE